MKKIMKLELVRDIIYFLKFLKELGKFKKKFLYINDKTSNFSN